ncbi:MAG: protein arginine kinase activator [Planctomycetota bacterium]|jgi:protein arginine kinase activator
MQYCTACQKAIATIVVMDLSEGSVTGSQHVCAECAEQLGVTPPKTTKFAAEMLEDLLGGIKPERRNTPRTECCPGCGLEPAEFRNKGRLGCPRCYDAFRHELMPLLQRIHEAQAHTGRLPSTMAETPEYADTPDLTDLRQKLEDAVRGERYEEAAQLRDDLRRAERSDTFDDNIGGDIGGDSER